MKILIATDGSAPAKAALESVLRLLNPSEREFDLLCVAPAYRRSDKNRKTYERRILQETTQILEDARAVAGAGGACVHAIAETGSAAALIVDRAGDYDLTVIGARGWGTPEAAGLGPVANRVVEHALAPVLIAREMRSDAGLRVLIAVDGSTVSRRAVEAFRDLFDRPTADVTLMHVAETPWIHLGLEDDWASASEEEQEASEAGGFEKEMMREGTDVLEEARDTLGECLAVTTRLAEGNPAEEILTEVDRGQYDLVVVGATGNRDLKHQMLGSVSSKVAWDAPCSVLVVRSAEEG